MFIDSEADTVSVSMNVDEMKELLVELEQRPIPLDQMMLQKLLSLLQWMRVTKLRKTVMRGG